jgi:hypothetical protein
MVKHTAPDASRTPERRWPPDPKGTGLFVARAPLRQLVAMVDAHLVDDASPAPAGTEADPTATEPDGRRRTHLRALLCHPMLDVHRYADDGPPPGTPVDPRSTTTPVYPGWVYVQTPLPPGGALMASGSAIVETANGWSLSGFMGNAGEVAAADTRGSFYADLGTQEAAAQRRRDVTAAQVADQAVHADVFVTERPYLLGTSVRPTRQTVVCSVAEATGLVGLYLRTQGDFVVADRFHYGRGLFYFVGARALLPSAWRWFAACVQHSTAAGDSGLLDIGESVLRRLTRALVVRDEVHADLCRAQDHDVADEVLAGVDEVCTLLMGALDAAARVAHRTLGLPAENEFGAGWQKIRRRGWLSQVGAAEPALAARVAAGSDGQAALEVLRLLRNTVHGAALRSMQQRASGNAAQTMILVPDDGRAAIEAAIAAVGPGEDGGAHQAGPWLALEPGRVVEQLFRLTIPLLDDLLGLTPVERLAGVVVTAESSSPPAGDASFAPEASEAIVWQLGL